MTRIITKLNSTGSLYKDNINGDIVSYNTPIYREFTLSNGKILKVFNATYYSATTRKHQSQIGHLRSYADLIVHYCPYGGWSLDTAFKNEITMTRYEIDKLNEIPHKLGKRQAERLKELITRLKVLQKLYKEVQQ